jgi:cobalamin biosynthesis protein CobD/CbiB
MEQEVSEKYLSDNGFSGKEISRLKEILSRQGNENESLYTLVEDLRSRFYGGVLCLLLTLSPLIFLPFLYSSTLTLYYIPLGILGVITIYFLTPLNLSWKAYKIMKGLNQRD